MLSASAARPTTIVAGRMAFAINAASTSTAMPPNTTIVISVLAVGPTERAPMTLAHGPTAAAARANAAAPMAILWFFITSSFVDVVQGRAPGATLCSLGVDTYLR